VFGSFGPCSLHVLGDVGVRFGGSEHHRIGISSCTLFPVPFGVRGLRSPRGAASGVHSRLRLGAAERFSASAGSRSGQDGNSKRAKDRGDAVRLLMRGTLWRV